MPNIDESAQNGPITVETTVDAPIEKVWECWTDADHITQWYYASDDWHAPMAENDLHVGGKFKTVMAAKDGSFSFDFEGIYQRVKAPEMIEYIMSDDRQVSIHFVPQPLGTKVIQTFDPESENPREMQQTGWQAILNNFKKHVEGH